MARDDLGIAGALAPQEQANLAALIQRAERNQAYLAVRLHAHESYISKLLHGRAGATLSRWRTICTLLNASLAELFGEQSAAERSQPEPSALDLADSLERQARKLRQLLEYQTPTAEVLAKRLAGQILADEPPGAGDRSTTPEASGTPDATPGRPRRVAGRRKGTPGR